MGKTNPFQNYNVIFSDSTTLKPSIRSRLGKTKQKPPSVYSRLGFQTPVKSKNLVLPKQPTPLRLYHYSRKNELFADGVPKDKIYEICLNEYKQMSDLHKMEWILKSLLEEPDYNVSSNPNLVLKVNNHYNCHTIL